MQNKISDYIGKFKVYFDRGYKVYLSFPLSVLNMSIIMYNFAFKNMVFIPEGLKRFYIFVPIVAGVILLTGGLLGKFDYAFGTYNSEIDMGYSRNKHTQRLETKIDKILERLNNESKS